MAYVKAYHYSNFDEVYQEFDRHTNILVGQDFQHLFKNSSDPGENFESFSYLRDLNMNDIHRKFFQMRSPLQTDALHNVIDYNWQVDGILKNSQSYNKGDNIRNELQERPSAIYVTAKDIVRVRTKKSAAVKSESQNHPLASAGK
jgi:hypothetical protein